MITIYTTPSCSSCRKAKKWMEHHNIKYQEKNLLNINISENDIFNILSKTDNGFEDIISKRSKAFKENDLTVDDMSIQELIDFIKVNPSILKRPIIMDDRRMQIGYNDEEIEMFLPRENRYLVQYNNDDNDNELSEDNVLNQIIKI